MAAFRANRAATESGTSSPNDAGVDAQVDRAALGITLAFQPPDLTPCSSEYTLPFKALQKKDATTRVKALTDLAALFAHASEIDDYVLYVWVCHDRLSGP